jgi:serine/threonine-protein kinase HipA
MLTLSHLNYAKVSMSLYLVGENIDKTRSHYLAETGKLTQLMRGIYASSDENIDELVLKHSVRIAKYLYPRAYLSAVSAIMLGPTLDGKLFISGPRNQRTRIRQLEIIQNKAPEFPSTAPAIIDDGMGEFKVEVSSIRQRFLESFRRQSEHASSIDHVMRRAIAQRVIEEYDSPEQAADALWILARQNAWYWEGEQADRFLKRSADITPITNEASFRLIVAWHGEPIGTLSHDGFEWHWLPSKEFHLPLVRQTIPGKLPPFISALLPEGWLENVLKSEDERSTLRSGKRYMSNITISDSLEDIRQLPDDILETPLARYCADGVFTGHYAGPAKSDLHSSFERNLAILYQNSDTPRLSGVQIKAPMYLDANGYLLPSAERPFTHILKPAGTSGFESLPIIEWLSLHLSASVGFEAPAFALINMPDEMPPALIVERFDIRQSPDDDRLICLEDFCSLLDLTTADKYKGTIEQAARALKAISTSPQEDLLILFKRALFAWFIADGDMHLKNMAVLKITRNHADKFQSVRMAPIYDVVSTVVFPGLKHDRMALKMNGKDSRLKRKDYMMLASIMGLKASDAESVVHDMLLKFQSAVDMAALPQDLGYTDTAQSMVAEMLDIIRTRLTNFN